MENCSYYMPWIFPILFPIVFPILFMFFYGKNIWIRSGSRSRMDNSEQKNSYIGQATQKNNPALEKLKMRLAEGEITIEQYNEMKKVIEQHDYRESRIYCE